MVEPTELEEGASTEEQLGYMKQLAEFTKSKHDAEVVKLKTANATRTEAARIDPIDQRLARAIGRSWREEWGAQLSPDELMQYGLSPSERS